MTGQDNLSKEESKDCFLKTVAHLLNLCGFGKATNHAYRDTVVTLLSQGEPFFFFLFLIASMTFPNISNVSFTLWTLHITSSNPPVPATFDELRASLAAMTAKPYAAIVHLGS